MPLTSHNAPDIIAELIEMSENKESIDKMMPLIKELQNQGQLNDRTRNLLHYAVSVRNVTLATVLLEAGADPAVIDFNCLNALTFAISNYRKGLWNAEEKEHFALLELMIDKNPESLKVRYMGFLADGDTILHSAVHCNSLALFILLVSKGADLYAQNKHEVTPLRMLQEKFPEITAQKIQKMVQEKNQPQSNDLVGDNSPKDFSLRS